MNEVLVKRLIGACALVGITLVLANLLPEPSASPPPEPAARRVTYELRPAQLPDAPVPVADSGVKAMETASVTVPAPAEPAPKAAGPKLEPPPAPHPKPVAPKQEPRPAPKPQVVAVAKPPVPAAAEAEPKPQPIPAAPTERWFVQIGAFARESNAQRSVAKLRKAGLQARQDTLEWKSGTRYRVRCGPFASRAEAEAERERATKLGFGDARLAQEPAG